MGFQIALDGPAGAGKSTIAKKVAADLGYTYVDTGAMYRAVGLYFLRNQIDLKDEAAVVDALEKIDIDLDYVDGLQQVFLNGENVSTQIRNTEAGNMASNVGTLAPVRKKLVALQQHIGEVKDIVMDGRDICMYVLPNANVKVYLTASVKERATRRYKEYIEKGRDVTLEQIIKEVEERDYQDMNREVSPLQQAPDATLVDSSDMTIDEVVEAIIRMAKEAE